MCEGLTKRFGSVAAVDHVDLRIRRGEIVALLGPSGCGKTTFLRLVAGFEQPDEGSIQLVGREVAGSGPFVPPERRRVGVVFQDYALFPHMTAGANVAYGLNRRSFGRAARRQRVQALLELVGLASLGNRYPHELSGGQQQRVALARALAPSPSVVLFDEPFSSLDATLRVQVRLEVHEIIRSAKATAVFVTHDQEEALSLADRVAVMQSGRILQVDTPDRLYASPVDRFVAAFVGDADIVRGVSDGNQVTCVTGVLRPSASMPAGPVDVVLRAENVRLRLDGQGHALVLRSTYFGHDQLVEVAMEDGTRLRSRMGPAHRFESGDRVAVTVAGNVTAFPADHKEGMFHRQEPLRS